MIQKKASYGVLGGGVAALVASWFLELKFAVAIGVVLGLMIVYFALGEVELSAKIKTSDGDSDCTLTVTESNGTETNIDCSMLGRSRFYKLLDTLHVTDPEPVAVSTKKKNR